MFTIEVAQEGELMQAARISWAASCHVRVSTDVWYCCGWKHSNWPE